MEHASRSTLLRLMRGIGIRKGMLNGRYRASKSSRQLETMFNALSDPVEYFRKAMSIELEHGSANQNTNITHDGMKATSKIVAAHIFGVEHGERPMNWRPFPAYYDFLIEMEKKGPRVTVRVEE